MNEQLKEFARKTLKEGLAKCTDAEQLMFKRMYSHKVMDKNINDVVDDMDPENLDRAMQQVQRTIDKKAKNGI